MASVKGSTSVTNVTKRLLRNPFSTHITNLIMQEKLFTSVNNVPRPFGWRVTWALMFEWSMTKSGQISVTFVRKVFIIKEILSAIRNMYTIFMNNNFLFLLQNWSRRQTGPVQPWESWKHWPVSLLLLSRMWYQTENQIRFHYSCHWCSSRFSWIPSIVWLWGRWQKPVLPWYSWTFEYWI